MSLYKKNPAWRRNPRKLARALAALMVKVEHEKAEAALDSARAEYERIQREANDGRVG